MNRPIKPLKHFVFVALAALPLLAAANTGDDVDKKKTISKTYTVTADDKLSIENQFGNVVIKTWDKNEIKVDIEIGTKASTDEKAQDMLDEIQVTDSKDDHNISFVTSIGDMGKHNNNRNKDDDRNFYVDYSVYMPAVNALNIENQFGKTTLPDFKGQVSLTSKFGALTTGDLENVDDIDVEFGSADIGAIRNGDVTFKFNQKSYVKSVSGVVKIKSEFSNDVRFDVSKSIEELTVLESYSTVKMVVTKDLSANFDVHTSFGNFRNSTAINIAEEKEDDEQYGPKFDKDYSGKAGDGKAKIKIKSSFGKVRVTDSDTKVEVNDNDEGNEGDNDSKQPKHKDKKKSVTVS